MRKRKKEGNSLWCVLDFLFNDWMWGKCGLRPFAVRNLWVSWTEVVVKRSSCSSWWKHSRLTNQTPPQLVKTHLNADSKSSQFFWSDELMWERELCFLFFLCFFFFSGAIQGSFYLLDSSTDKVINRGHWLMVEFCWRQAANKDLKCHCDQRPRWARHNPLQIGAGRSTHAAVVRAPVGRNGEARGQERNVGGVLAAHCNVDGR